ncbi:MAG: tetratricopeptide repeat protein [Planctomycetota bacterium]
MTEPDQDPIERARAEFDDSRVSPSKASKPSEVPGEAPDTIIDRYKLLQAIGEGGMGTVWMAEQVEPVRRQVALKIIKLGMDTKEVVVRFEAERQALALMDHPNIARVLDGGATAQGRPYFVMELVRGVPITDYCDQARIGLRERLDLFARVCEAIQHAHQKGVIHRDIKPSNVMVTLHDGEPVPKVIDFGIAKATSAELTQKTMFTRYGNMIGTPEYMAPEQAEMSGLDIDTRADVYSLGVLLYELLTGTKPFEVTEVLDRGFQELLRTIREDEPAKPSTRISTLGEQAATIARDRMADASALRLRLRGEIDWIVMKALEKDRRRRYETANEFAADVHRFLDGEAVSAAPPSRTYRLRKFLARRRAAVLSAAAILILFIAGAVGTGVGWWQANQANDKLSAANDELAQANTKLEQANREKSQALANERDARQAAETAEAAVVQKNQRFRSMLNFHEARLAEMSPQTAGEQLREILERETPPEQREALRAALAGINFTDVGIASLERAIVDPTLNAIDDWNASDVSAKARLLNGAGVTLNALRNYSRSLTISEQALELLEENGQGDSDLALTLRSSIAVLLCVLGQPEAAEPYARTIIARSKQTGADPAAVGQAHYSLGMALLGRVEYEGAAENFRTAIELMSTKLDVEDRMIWFARTGLLNALLQSNKLEEAEALARESLAISRGHLPDHHQRVVTDRLGLIEVLRRRNTLRGAEPALDGLIEDARRAFGVASQQVADAALVLSLFLMDSDKVDEAELLLRTELEAFTEHKGAISDRERLASALVRAASSRGDFEAASAHSERQLEQARERGETGKQLIERLLNRGITAKMRGELDEAEACLTEALEEVERLGRLELVGVIIRTQLAATWSAQGRYDEAVATLRVAIEESTELVGPDHVNTQLAKNSLAVALQRQGNFEEALPLFEQVVEHNRQTYGDDHQNTLFARGNYGTVLQNLQRTEEALAVFRDVHAKQAIVLGENHPFTLNSKLNVGGALLGLERFEDARDALYEVIGPLEQAFGPEHPQTLYALRVTGEAGFAAGDPDRGEELLRRSLAIARKKQTISVPSTLYVLGNQLLKAGHPDRAEEALLEVLELRVEDWDGDYREPNTRLRIAASRGMQDNFSEHVAELEELLAAMQTAPRGEAAEETFDKTLRTAREVALRYYEAWQREEPAAAVDAAIARLRGELDQDR